MEELNLPLFSAWFSIVIKFQLQFKHYSFTYQYLWLQILKVKNCINLFIVVMYLFSIILWIINKECLYLEGV